MRPILWNMSAGVLVLSGLLGWFLWGLWRELGTMETVKALAPVAGILVLVMAGLGILGGLASFLPDQPSTGRTSYCDRVTGDCVDPDF